MDIFEAGVIKARNKRAKREREYKLGREAGASHVSNDNHAVKTGREEQAKGKYKPEGKKKKEITEMKLSEKVCMVIKQLGGKGKKAKKLKVNEVYSRLLNILTEGNKANKALKNKREVSTGSKILRNEYDKGKATIPSTKQKDLEKRLARDTQRPNSTIDYGGRYRTNPKPFLKLDLEDKVKSPKPKLP